MFVPTTTLADLRPAAVSGTPPPVRNVRRLSDDFFATSERNQPARVSVRFWWEPWANAIYFGAKGAKSCAVRNPLRAVRNPLRASGLGTQRRWHWANAQRLVFSLPRSERRLSKPATSGTNLGRLSLTDSPLALGAKSRKGGPAPAYRCPPTTSAWRRPSPAKFDSRHPTGRSPWIPPCPSRRRDRGKPCLCGKPRA